MSRSGRKTHLEVQEGLGGPPRCPGVVWKPSRMSLSGGKSYQISGSGKEACRMSVSGQEALPDIREWSGVPPGCPGVVEGTYG